MKRLIGLVVGTTMLAYVVYPTLAQQPAAPSGSDREQAQPAPGAQGQPGPQRPPGDRGPGGMTGGAGMGGMMDMHGMMAGMRGGRGGDGPMGLCPTAAMLAHHDAKVMARSLKLCGDLMKAMSDVLLKHAAELDRLPPAASTPPPRR